MALGWLEIAKRAATFWDCREAVVMTFSKVVCVAKFRANTKSLIETLEQSATEQSVGAVVGAD